MFFSQAKHALTTATKKALSRPGNRGTGGGGGGGGEGREELRLGMDSHDSSLLPPAQPEGRRGRARGRSTGADTTAAEMISNPKVSTVRTVQQLTVVHGHQLDLHHYSNPSLVVQSPYCKQQEAGWGGT